MLCSIFAFLFFIMLLMLGLDSAFAWVLFCRKNKLRNGMQYNRSRTGHAHLRAAFGPVGQGRYKVGKPGCHLRPRCRLHKNRHPVVPQGFAGKESFTLAARACGCFVIWKKVETIQTYALDYLRTQNPCKPITKRQYNIFNTCSSNYFILKWFVFLLFWFCKMWFRHTLALLLICSIGFVMGLIFTTRAGFMFLDVVDHFCPTYCMLTAAFLQYILFGYVYGSDKIMEHIRNVSPNTRIPGLQAGSRFEFIW